MSAAAEPLAGAGPAWVETAGRLGAKAGSVVITLFGLLALTFAIGRLIPADPVLLVLGDKADHGSYVKLYHALGLDQPVWRQFANYCGAMLHGNFGNSIITSNPVAVDIASVFPATFELALVALAIALAIGVPVGVLAAAHRGRPIDHAVRLLGLVGYSAPGFWLSLMGLMLFYGELGWIPGPGRLNLGYSYSFEPWSGFVLLDSALGGQWDVFGNALGHLILPASVLGYASAAYISRMTRSFMLEQLGQDYIVAAQVKGVGRRGVVWGHAFRSIRVQLLTVIVLVFAYQLEGSVLVETIFAWPGFGRYAVNAMLFGDMNAVLASVLLVGTLFIALNQVTDLLYRVLDPRTR